jgi:hypothetical protein
MAFDHFIGITEVASSLARDCFGSWNVCAEPVAVLSR